MSSGIDDDTVLQELQRIVNSDEFRNAKRLKEFITYAVFETLAGTKRNLSGYAIGVEVFGRRPDFDSQADPVVRVSANKLRLKLERYYALEGRNNPLRIEIPRGAYLAEFKPVPVHSTDAAAPSPADTTPVLCIDAFECLSHEPEHVAFCKGLFSEICLALASLEHFMLVAPPQWPETTSGVPTSPSEHAAGGDLVFSCNVRWTATHVRFIAQVIDRARQGIAWIGAKDFALDVADPVSTQRSAASFAATEIARVSETWPPPDHPTAQTWSAEDPVKH